MIYKDIVDTVTDYFSKEERYLSEIVASKDVFFAKTGKVFEDDPFYEARMAAFVEWFILDRPLTRVGLTPVRYYYELFLPELDEQTRNSFKSLIYSLHSLFQFQGRSGPSVRVIDLYNGDKYDIFEQRQYVGINPGSIFEGRIVRSSERWYFSDTYCIHPYEASKQIVKEIKKRRLIDRDPFMEFMFELSALRLKCDRYKKVDVTQIYGFTDGKMHLKSVNL